MANPAPHKPSLQLGAPKPRTSLRDRGQACSCTPIPQTPSAASCCCCMPRGTGGVSKPLGLPSSPLHQRYSHLQSKGERQLASPIFLRTSTKIKPVCALGSSGSGGLLASARSLGSPFPWHPGHPPQRATACASIPRDPTDGPRAPIPPVSRSPGGLGLRLAPGKRCCGLKD